MDLDRISHPLRLARGSHQPGSGKGFAMNAISYINGDEQITDVLTGVFYAVTYIGFGLPLLLTTVGSVMIRPAEARWE